MRALKSSWIESGDYSKEEKALTIKLKAGKTMTLYEVPPATAEGLFAASSPGEYFAKFLRGKYSTVKPRARR